MPKFQLLDQGLEFSSEFFCKWDLASSYTMKARRQNNTTRRWLFTVPVFLRYACVCLTVRTRDCSSTQWTKPVSVWHRILKQQVIYEQVQRFSCFPPRCRTHCAGQELHSCSVSLTFSSTGSDFTHQCNPAPCFSAVLKSVSNFWFP